MVDLTVYVDGTREGLVVAPVQIAEVQLLPEAGWDRTLEISVTHAHQEVRETIRVA